MIKEYLHKLFSFEDEELFYQRIGTYFETEVNLLALFVNCDGRKHHIETMKSRNDLIE